MKVIIDPNIKSLFINRVTEMCNGSKYDALKWIESIAYGELDIEKLDKKEQDEIDNLKKQISLLTRLKQKDEKLIVILENKIHKINKKYSDMDTEVNSYLNEIQFYRNILTAHGLTQDIEDYEENFDDD